MTKIESKKRPGQYLRTPDIREKNRKGASNGMKKWHQNHKHPLLGKHHSDETKRKMSQNRKGSKNGNWKGGITLSVRTFRKSKQYQQWRKYFLKISNWKCAYFNCDNKTVIVHHIYPVKEYPRLRLDYNNGEPLCNYHHKIKHQESKRIV